MDLPLFLAEKMIESVSITDRTPISIWTKLNPLWWLVGPDGWTVPEINNGSPYLPDVKNIWLRRFYWFFCRNPLMNFVGYVLGAEDKNYTVYGSAPVLKTTLRDADPPMTGWKWSVIVSGFSLGAAVVALAFAALAWLVSWVFAVPLVFALLKAIGLLPFVAYWGGKVEFYLGWRAHSGGYGLKFVVTGND